MGARVGLPDVESLAQGRKMLQGDLTKLSWIAATTASALGSFGNNVAELFGVVCHRAPLGNVCAGTVHASGQVCTTCQGETVRSFLCATPANPEAVGLPSQRQ